MRGIKFTAPYYTDADVVSVKIPDGIVWDYYIIIGCWYHGTMHRKGKRWVAHLNDGSDLTSDDIQILGEMLLEAKKLKKWKEDEI